MAHFNWRTAALLALTTSAFTAYAVAQEPSSDSQGKSDSSQNAASNDSKQGQSQASDNKKSNDSSKAQSDKSQGSQDSKSSQDRSKQDQSNQNRDDRSSSKSTSRDDSSSKSRDRDERGSARSDRDDRSDSRDRSNRDYDRNNDRNDNRNADSRSRSDRDRDSSRDQSSRRDNMRGPDIGIWFSRSGNGLVIADVSSRGPIAKLGFREGDRIVSVNGQRVTREDEFIRYVLRSESRRVTVIVLRDNREETIYVEPAVLIDDHDYVEVDPLERFGIIVDDRYDDRIVVWRVIPRSPAYYAGFRPGDVIVKFGDRPYRTRTEFERGSRDWKAGDVEVQVRRGERTRDLSVEIPTSDRSDGRTSERSERRDERTAQRDSNTSDQGNTDRSDRTNNNNQDNNNRGGILNGVRGRGNR